MSYLIALYKVGIKIMLSVEFGKIIYPAAEGVSGLNSEFYIFLAYSWKSSGQTETAGADSRVWNSAVTVFARTKSLCLR